MNQVRINDVADEIEGRDPVRTGDEAVPVANRAATPDGQRAAVNMVVRARAPSRRPGGVAGIAIAPMREQHQALVAGCAIATATSASRGTVEHLDASGAAK
jgi:hypothetical protein